MPPLGNHGLWLALLLFMAARGLWLGACYLRIDRAAGFVAASTRGKPT
jgi:MATE family multidrug resistance protein